MKVAANLFALLVCLAQPALAEDRFPQLTPEQLTPEQQKVAETIMSGPRASMIGPFNTWLRSPILADRLQQVGKYIRFENSLSPRQREFAILINSRAWNSAFEWYAHYPFAMTAGLDPKIAGQLAKGRRPTGMQADEAAIYDFCMELHRNHDVREITYQAARKALGEQGVVDLIATSGYYDIVSMTLNVAQVPVPADSTVPPLPVLKRHPHG